MSREIDPIDRNDVARTQAHRNMEPPRPNETPEPSRERIGLIGRAYAYQVSPAELQTMVEIGRFRTVAVDDLACQRYKGNADHLRQDLRSLINQGLVQRRTIWTDRNKDRLTVVVLTKQGKDVLERAAKAASGQQLYAGFVKPAEVAHDAAIYRMFDAEARQIEKAGGRLRRVVLDYELKQKVYSPLAKARALPPLDYARRQAEVARENGLKVIEGKIPLPDLRIEYETREGEMARVDLELATHHYHGSHLQTKAEAGFKMYAPDSSVGRLSAVLEEREITAGIFSL